MEMATLSAFIGPYLVGRLRRVPVAGLSGSARAVRVADRQALDISGRGRTEPTPRINPLTFLS